MQASVNYSEHQSSKYTRFSKIPDSFSPFSIAGSMFKGYLIFIGERSRRGGSFGNIIEAERASITSKEGERIYRLAIRLEAIQKNKKWSWISPKVNRTYFTELNNVSRVLLSTKASKHRFQRPFLLFYFMFDTWSVHTLVYKY